MLPSADAKTIETVMDVIDQPMFLVDVEGPSVFRFRRLNPCHADATGMRDDDIAGQRPEDIFPARLAEALISRYETCRASGASHSYEENLELPSGARWWHTTLSPIYGSSGEVRRLVGMATDITDRKLQQFNATQQLADLSRHNAELQVFAATTAQNMRGPFQTMLALLEIVREDFVDLGDEKGEQLALCSEIASKAVHAMTGVLAAAEHLHVGEVLRRRIDIHHFASDIAASVDAHQRLSIDLPHMMVETDAAALQMVLRRVMENAVHYADASVRVKVAENGNDEIAITVSDDGASDPALIRCDGMPVLPAGTAKGGSNALPSARAIVEARGGTMSATRCRVSNQAAIEFTLPGTVLSETAEPAVNLPQGAVMRGMVGPTVKEAGLRH